MPSSAARGDATCGMGGGWRFDPAPRSLHRSGATASQWNPGGHVPPALLSPIARCSARDSRPNIRRSRSAGTRAPCTRLPAPISRHSPSSGCLALPRAAMTTEVAMINKRAVGSRSVRTARGSRLSPRRRPGGRVPPRPRRDQDPTNNHPGGRWLRRTGALRAEVVTRGERGTRGERRGRKRCGVSPVRVSPSLRAPP